MDHLRTLNARQIMPGHWKECIDCVRVDRDCSFSNMIICETQRQLSDLGEIYSGGSFVKPSGSSRTLMDKEQFSLIETWVSTELKHRDLIWNVDFSGQKDMVI